MIQEGGSLFYFLSKLLPRLVYPAGLSVGLLILALFLRKRRRWSVALAVLAMAVIWLGGNNLVSMGLVRALEWRYPPLTLPLGRQADAIVVLGGGTRPQLPPRPSHEIGEAGDRLIYAAQLYRAGAAPLVIVSGAHSPMQNHTGPSEAEAMADLLVFMGVPRDRILLEAASRNTYENGVESSRVLAQHDLSHVILVTSAMHMPRAYAVFEKQGVDATPAPTDFMLTVSDWSFYTRPDLSVQLLNLLPKAEYMELTEKALKEMIGIVVYRLRGWL